ncbi:MAG TPA: triose-phosphate isomerase [Firmicutes bacterium]|nr:triose-phosphate isomerase [Bacillota bacterium]HBM70392.1 triose-phosphate isomerase [Bacillota bacterium]HBX24683.1 triose-phosphate isomerase [Bacillota bacterium]
MRKKLLMGNWKMNKTPSEAKEFALGCKDMVEFAVSNNIDVGVAPTYVCLQTVKENADKKLIVSAQNCSSHDHGAYTGEISIPMLKEIGIDWVILGHSERREYDAETSVKCNAKIKALLAAGMTPLYCCGESLETFEKGETKSFVETQIKEGLDGLTAEEASKVVIAYEPIWAIGTGKNATSAIAEDTISHIRKVLFSMFGNVAEDIRILYGGSVKPNNIAEYMAMKDIDGALVGGASLTLDSYKGLIEGLVK